MGGGDGEVEGDTGEGELRMRGVGIRKGRDGSDVHVCDTSLLSGCICDGCI